jgi:hypothetical protein
MFLIIRRRHKLNIMKLLIFGAILVLATSGQLTFAVPTSTTSGFIPYAHSSTATTSYLPQQSPTFPTMAAATDVVTSYNPGPYSISTTLDTYQLSGYPTVWVTPDTTHP